jgi:O-acetyl-ADP-ribose deacetylase (regulator of RNase III)
MGSYKEIPGNLIEMANDGHFDFIAHGCNCFCTMGAGIAPHMAREYGCNDPYLYPMEGPNFIGDHKKLGKFEVNTISVFSRDFDDFEDLGSHNDMIVANIYSQYHYGKPGPDGIPLEYKALERALFNIGLKYPKPMRIGLPRIGCGLAGGDWKVVSDMIKVYLKDHDVTIPIM